MSQDAARIIGALANTAANANVFVLRYFTEPLTQFRERDVLGAWDMPLREILGVSDVQELESIPFKSFPGGRLHFAAQNVGGDHAGEIDRIFGRAILRRITQFGLLQIEDG